MFWICWNLRSSPALMLGDKSVFAVLGITGVSGTLLHRSLLWSLSPNTETLEKKKLCILDLRTGEGNGTPLQYSCLENPMDGGAWWATVHGVIKSQTWLSDFTFTFTFMHWRRKWQPTPGSLPGESQGWGSLVGCCLWGRTESDTTEVT